MEQPLSPDVEADYAAKVAQAYALGCTVRVLDPVTRLVEFVPIEDSPPRPEGYIGEFPVQGGPNAWELAHLRSVKDAVNP
jgi:hypothetical protein